MRIGIISAPPRDPATASQPDLDRLRQHVRALATYGLQAFWLSSTATVEALEHDPTFVPETPHSLPATCRYVIPCQPYRFAGVPVFCTERILWQQRPLHTRLFTFLCLLQRELPGVVWHLWGGLSTAFLAVYTARFLGVPTVMSYSSACIRDPFLLSFEGQWVSRHLSLALVTSATDRARLIATGGCPPDRVCIHHPASATPAMVTLYQNLHGSRGV